MLKLMLWELGLRVGAGVKEVGMGLRSRGVGGARAGVVFAEWVWRYQVLALACPFCCNLGKLAFGLAAGIEELGLGGFGVGVGGAGLGHLGLGS